MLKVSVVEGDITQQSVDAIATLANTEEMWFGGVDGAIMRRWGGFYHKQAQAYLEDNRESAEGKVFYAKPNSLLVPGVLFCFDDLNLPLRNLVYALLEKAELEILKRLAFPAFRCGVMASTTSIEAVLTNIRLAFREFDEKYPDNTIEVTFVIYRDTKLYDQFKRGLS